MVRSHRLTVRTAPFHGTNGGSIPPGITNSNKEVFKALKPFLTPISQGGYNNQLLKLL